MKGYRALIKEDWANLNLGMRLDKESIFDAHPDLARGSQWVKFSSFLNLFHEGNKKRSRPSPHICKYIFITSREVIPFSPTQILIYMLHFNLTIEVYMSSSLFYWQPLSSKIHIIVEVHGCWVFFFFLFLFSSVQILPHQQYIYIYI